MSPPVVEMSGAVPQLGRSWPCSTPTLALEGAALRRRDAGDKGRLRMAISLVSGMQAGELACPHKDWSGWMNSSFHRLELSHPESGGPAQHSPVDTRAPVTQPLPLKPRPSKNRCTSQDFHHHREDF